MRLEQIIQHFHKKIIQINRTALIGFKVSKLILIEGKIEVMISHRIEIVCSLGWSKWHMLIKSMVVIIHLMEFEYTP